MLKAALLVASALAICTSVSCKPKGDKAKADSSADAKKSDDKKPTSSASASASGAATAGASASAASSDEAAPKDVKDDTEHSETPQAKDLGDDNPQKLSDKPVDAKPKAVALDVPDSRVRLTMPPGWKAKRAGDWWLMAPKSNKALFAFVSFDKPNESTHRIGEIAHVLGTGNIDWHTPKWYTLGPNHLQARTSQGSSGGWDVLYATINPGDAHQVLAVYATTTGVSTEDKTMVRRILGSVRLHN